MVWASPIYSKKDVLDAGRVLVQVDCDEDKMLRALEIVNNWRSSHSFPLNTFQTNLRLTARNIDDNVIVAQRIKRLSSIREKLRRYPQMTLPQMQDIGGCRAIVRTLDKVMMLRKAYRNSKVKHTIQKENNYISHPKESGYRGIHLVWSYHSDRKSTFNGLRIEMQLRTKNQHAWATAVETAGTFMQQSLKSSRGERDWLRFFALMGSVIAEKEKSPYVPNTPTKYAELIGDVRDLATRLNVLHSLQAYGETIKVLEANSDAVGMHYFLMELDAKNEEVEITGYEKSEAEEAAIKYLDIESKIRDIHHKDAVLVSVDSIKALKQAYPNYFLDSSRFLTILQRVTKRNTSRTRKKRNNKQTSLF